MNVNGCFVSTASVAHQPGRPALAFVHGAGMDHTVWTPFARCFARHGLNVINPDLPGHGRSQGPPLTSIHDMAEWLLGLLDGLGQARASLVGHSMGSLVALDFAAHHPERTDALALLGTSAPMAVADKLLDAARANRHDAIDMANGWSHRGLLGGAENSGMWNLTAGARLLERARPGVFHADLSACNGFTGGLELAAAVTARTLVVIAGNDLMTAPVNAARVAAAISGARVERIADCGHSMMAEQPNRVLDALSSHILTGADG